jgi:predicted PurR-regulated permease PerM
MSGGGAPREGLAVSARLGAGTLALAGLLALLWLLGDVLLPFVLGALIAYLADPACRRLERRGLGRATAGALVILGGIGIGAAALLLILPVLIEQGADAVSRAPDALDALRARLHEGLVGGLGAEGRVAELIAALRARAEGLTGEALARAWSGGKALLTLLGLAVVTPVVAFYLILGWDDLLSGIDGLVPPRHRAVVRRLAREIDGVLAGFLRGQVLVCLALGSFYALALSAIGLEFGVLIGLFAGAVSFVPYVGASTGGALSVGVAAVQFWPDWIWIGAVAGVFVVGQLVEGYGLTPTLVGRRVGLHPVWLIFALAAFGALFGFVGLLLAVPGAAALGVLVRYAVDRYRESAFFAREGGPGA